MRKVKRNNKFHMKRENDDHKVSNKKGKTGVLELQQTWSNETIMIIHGGYAGETSNVCKDHECFADYEEVDDGSFTSTTRRYPSSSPLPFEMKIGSPMNRLVSTDQGKRERERERERDREITKNVKFDAIAKQYIIRICESPINREWATVSEPPLTRLTIMFLHLSRGLDVPSHLWRFLEEHDRREMRSRWVAALLNLDKLGIANLKQMAPIRCPTEEDENTCYIRKTRARDINQEKTRYITIR
ncbi:hypothetical protein LXL04_022767 [Taraxacum kok-saghyz]